MTFQQHCLSLLGVHVCIRKPIYAQKVLVFFANHLFYCLGRCSIIKDQLIQGCTFVQGTTFFPPFNSVGSQNLSESYFASYSAAPGIKVFATVSVSVYSVNLPTCLQVNRSEKPLTRASMQAVIWAAKTHSTVRVQH